MNEYLDIILSVLPVLTLFALGYFLQKIRFFQPESVPDIRKIVVSIALPCVLFLAFSQLELQLSLLAIVVVVFGVCVVMVLIGKGVAGMLQVSSPYFALLFGGFETGMLGYAIFISVYGMEEVDKLAIIDLGQVLFVFFVLMALLIKLRDGAQRFGQLLRLFLTSPVIISIFLGIFVSLLKRVFDFSGTQWYLYIEDVASMLGNLTVPLICIVIGYELKLDFQTLRLSAQTILIRTVLLLGFALAINKILFVRILHLGPMYEYALLTMFVLPPPFVMSLFLKEEDQANQHYVVNTLSLSTLVSLVVFIVVMMVYR